MTNPLYQLPKVELHCHLDGSVDLHALSQLYHLAGLRKSQEDLLKEAVAPENCLNLTEYLRCFPVTTQVLASEKALMIAVLSLAKQAVAEGGRYLEIRFSPDFIQTPTFSMEQVLQATIEGLELAQAVYPIRLGLILCMMRGRSEAVNRQVLRLAEKYLGRGVVALDVAGDESKYPMPLFKDLFFEARAAGIPFTAHAGETGNLDNVLWAVDYGAQRIGHGIALMKDLSQAADLKSAGILLEMCPISNLQTGASVSWATYPFAIFRETGLPVSINTDNRTVSSSSLTQEFGILNDQVDSLTVGDVYQITRDSAQAAFLPEADKLALLQELDQAYQAFDLKAPISEENMLE